jgi:hypothetical protein
MLPQKMSLFSDFNSNRMPSRRYWFVYQLTLTRHCPFGNSVGAAGDRSVYDKNARFRRDEIRRAAAEQAPVYA